MNFDTDIIPRLIAAGATKKQINASRKRWASALAQKPVKSIGIMIEWKKSRMWGRNPHLSAHVEYMDGTGEWFKATCGGCGYDKESTVIADAFNRFLTRRAVDLFSAGGGENSRIRGAWGLGDVEFPPAFDAGAGVSTCRTWAESLGYDWDCVASSKTANAYRMTIKEGF